MKKIELTNGTFQILSYPYFFSFIIVVMCYIKSIRSLKKCPVEIRLEMESTIKKVYVYPLAQLLLILPSAVCIPLVWIYEFEESALILELTMAPFFLFGFVTAFLCYKQQRSPMNLAKSAMIIQDLDQSEDYMSEIQSSFEYGEM